MDSSKSIKMTKNEYNAFLEKNAERLHTEADYTLQDFKRDAESVQVLGFELSRFQLNEKDCGVINAMFETEQSAGDRALFRGHVLESRFVNLIANTLSLKNICDKGHNGFFCSDEKRCVFEFCEGDISLSIYNSDFAYRVGLDEYNKFYELPREMVCIKVLFDGVHMDNVFKPFIDIEETIKSIIEGGYADYNGGVKADWEEAGRRINPRITFEVERANEQAVNLSEVGDLVKLFPDNFDIKATEPSVAQDNVGAGSERLTLASLIQRAEKLADESNALKNDLKAFKEKNEPDL